MHLPDGASFKLLGTIDTTALKARLRSLPDQAWHLFRHSNSEHALNADVQSITLRAPRVIGGGPDFTDNPAAFALLGSTVAPLIDFLPAAHRIRIARLPPGGVIPLHIDAAHFYALRHRVHFVIESNSEVVFTVGEQSISMPEGSVYEINNKLPHAVYNRGTSDRIHMVVDYYDGETKSAVT